MKLLFPFLALILMYNVLFAGETDSISVVVEEYVESVDPFLPTVNALIEESVTDPSICKGPNKTYYLTGTSGDKNGVQDGIKVWASKDLKNWNSIGTNGYVWTFEDDGADWQKVISTKNGWKQRGIIAPKIYYLQNTFWITYTNSNSNTSGILKSMSGWAQGPYADLGGEAPLINSANCSLFEDTDSSLYVIWGRSNIQRLNALLNDGASTYRNLLANNQGSLTGDVLQMQKIKDKYVLNMTTPSSVFSLSNRTADDLEYRNNTTFGVANSLLGPYTIQNLVIPHAANGWLFKSFADDYYLAFTGNDTGSPVAEKPCLLPMTVSEDGHISKKEPLGIFPTDETSVIYVSPVGNNSTGGSWDNAYTSIQRAVDNAPDDCQIWIAEGRYTGSVKISLKHGLYIYGGFKGDEEVLEERDTKTNRVVVSGNKNANHVVAVWSSSYIRIEGITITEGNADGDSFNMQYGGGMYILEGGETIRIVNCRFENNAANQDGGALYASVGAAPVVINCTFKENSAGNNGGAVAFYCNGLNGYQAKFVNCTFDKNVANSHGAAVYFDSNQRKFGLLSIANCLFTGNVARGNGGVLMLDRNANLMLYNSTFFNNHGTSNGTVIASLGKVPAQSRIANCIFSKNEGGTLFSIEGEAETEVVDNKLIVRKIWVEISHSLFDDNRVNSLVQRNFDRKSWKTINELNASTIGSRCKLGSPNFIDISRDNYRLLNSSGARAAGASNIGFFPFNIEGLRRSSTEKVNIGCY